MRRVLERLGARDIEGLTASLAPNYVRHCQAMPRELQEIRGRDAMHQWLVSNEATFPDYREEIEFLIGEGEFVAWRSKGARTQRGALGLFPASHIRYLDEGIDIPSCSSAFPLASTRNGVQFIRILG